VAEVGLECGGGWADGFGRFGGFAAVAVDGDLGSGLGECDGDGGAEAAGGSGDQGYFVVETEEVDGGGHEVECSWRRRVGQVLW
jgi:hypothetical protein